MTQKGLIKKPNWALDKDTIDTLITEWLTHEKLSNDATQSTIETYKVAFEFFLKWLEENSFMSTMITPTVLLHYKADLAKGYSIQTTNLRLTAIRSFYRFMVGTDRLPYSPAAEVKGLKRPKSKTHKKDTLTNQEILSVLDDCDIEKVGSIRDKAIIALMSHCGLRAIEIHRANIASLKTRGNRLILEVQGKGRREVDDYVVIPATIEQIVRLWLSHRKSFKKSCNALFVSVSNRSFGARLALRSIRWLVKTHFKNIGITESTKTTHSLRHSAITNAIRQGATPMQVQSMARHLSYDTTLGYYHEVSRLDNPAEDLINYNVQ